MLASWDSLDKVARLNDWLLAFAAIFAIIAAICTGLTWFTGKRISALQEIGRQTADATRDSKIEAAKREADAAGAAQAAAEYRLKEADARVKELANTSRAADVGVKQLEEQAAPRVLTAVQKSSLSAFLASHPTGSLIISASINAKDARNYAEQIGAIFSARGWTVKINNAIFTGGDTTGIWITVKDPTAPPPGASVAQQAFAAAGLKARGEYDPSLPIPDGSFSLSIGSK